MHYLVTDQNDQSWRGVQWGPNVTNEETNPNYFFGVYNSLNTAVFMYSFHEDFTQPKFWEADAHGSKEYRSEVSRATTLQPITPVYPTKEQRINFAILCCLNLVQNPVFLDWAKKYLAGEEAPNPETVGAKMLDLQFKDTDPVEYDYISCAHACLNAVMMEKPDFFVASCAHRAYHDSPANSRLDLGQIADIALLLERKQIHELMFSS